MPKITEGQYTLGGLTALAIWLFVALPFIIYSPTEIKAQKPNRIDQSEQQRATEAKGTANAPFFVEVIPTPKSAEELAAEATDRDEKKSADRWLVRWTASLFFATIGLIIATASLGYFASRQMRDMKESIAASKTVADAALMQARASVSSMRAHMVAGFPNPVAGAVWRVQITVENKGRATGTVGDTYVCFADELAAIPDYSKAVIREDSTVRSPGQFKTVGYFQAPHPKDGIFCYGFIKFSDEIGKWRTRFCVQIFSIPPAEKNYFHEPRNNAYVGEDEEL